MSKPIARGASFSSPRAHDALILAVCSARCTGRAEARSARDRLTHQHTLAYYNAPTQTHDTRHTTRYRVGTRGTAGRHALPEHGAPRRRVVHTKNLELCAPAGWRSSGSHTAMAWARAVQGERPLATGDGRPPPPVAKRGCCVVWRRGPACATSGEEGLCATVRRASSPLTQKWRSGPSWRCTDLGGIGSTAS